MWRNEWPTVACVREAYEETALRVSVVRELARFDSAHYILCSLAETQSADDVAIRERECIDFSWIDPVELLSLGTIMDLRRIIPVLELAGLRTPKKPGGLDLATPDRTY